MKVGGKPTDIYGIGDSRVNSIIGGQANRLAKDILAMPEDIKEFNYILEIKRKNAN